MPLVVVVVVVVGTFVWVDCVGCSFKWFPFEAALVVAQPSKGVSGNGNGNDDEEEEEVAAAAKLSGFARTTI